MTTEDAFLDAIVQQPQETSTRQVFADFLEERGDSRGEVLRLVDRLTQTIDLPDRQENEERLRSLLVAGVLPVGPYRTNSLGMRLAWIPAGTYLMGSPREEPHRSLDENQHPVVIPKPFWLSVHTITQAQWGEIMGTSPSHFQGNDLPVEKVSWESCQVFCQKLKEREGLAYRLPTEAQWEYACRAGTTTAFHYGNAFTSELANFNGRYAEGSSRRGKFLKTTRKAGCYPPNAWGLYDMHGNVCEWVEDLYGENYDGIKIEPFDDPRMYDPRDVYQFQARQYRVIRGGAWNGSGSSCRSAFRTYVSPTAQLDSCGFRIALDLPTNDFPRD